MGLVDQIPVLLAHIQAYKPLIEHNHKLFEIFEGDLAKYVLEDLRKQLSPQNFQQIEHRVAPINVLTKLIDKQAKIYSKPPQRYPENENTTDQELMDWYIQMFDLNVNGSVANEFFCLFKNSLYEPYVRDGKPYLRVCPSDSFLPFSNDKIDPTHMTHLVKFMGKVRVQVSRNKFEDQELYYVYTDEEFLPITDKGEVVTEILLNNNNPEGINPYGKIPFVYINRSRHQLIPLIDSDTLRMTKLFPVLLSDLNFSVMYQAFSIIYGIDLDTQDLSMSPSAFWNFKSDSTSDKKPEVGVIKPQVDISEVISFIISQLSFWLVSRNIRPGSIGQITADNLASGVSKVVDEMDTFEDRQKQVPYFKKAETELWDLLMHHVHPVWAKDGLIEERRLFSPGQKICVEFPEQKPMMDRTIVIANVKEELALGLTSRSEAILRLNPDLTEAQVEEFMAEIDEENTVEVPEEEIAPSLDQEVEENV